jgi:3-(3-hydroxy-phenyl)propionate hydroxylase/6-hydroxy-3-succinoylpyridine 3-monooxygenase
VHAVNQTDVTIVGAGPVGLTLALYLARDGVDVTVLEREAAVSRSPRAVTYLHQLLGDLEGLGMLPEMLRRGVRDRDGFTMHLPTLGEVFNIPMTALDGIDPHPYNINLGQGEFCDIALGLLRGLPTAHVHFGAEVTGVEESPAGRVSAQFTRDGAQDSLRSQWLVGADGGRSTVRHHLGVPLEGTTWAERFVATNVRFDFRARGFNTSNMYVHPEHGCIVAQITPDGLWRCTFQESDTLDEDTVADRVPQHFQRLLGAEGASVELVDFRPYRMHQRLASTLRSGRVVLAGDAAHLTNPTGGLGLTTGLYDVILLQEVLRAVLAGADEDLLDHYAAERSRVFREVSSPNAAHFKQLVYGSSDPAVLSEQVAGIRAAAATPEGHLAFLSGVDLVRSPSLATAAATARGEDHS